MSLPDLLAAVEALARPVDGLQPLGAGGLMLYRMGRSTAPDQQIYEPVFSLILQGAKSIRTGTGAAAFRAGQSILIGVDLLVTTKVTEATPSAPYLSLSIRPDLATLRDLAADAPPPPPGGPGTFGAAEAEARVTAAMGRLLSLASDPRSEAVLSPLLRREIHWWMLEGPHGPLLRRLIRADGPAARIARAVAVIRAEPSRELRIPDLAREAGMSPSAFHAHFRAATGTTPLQFQKSLRLLQARARLRAGAAVASAAWDVGYESPTQFSRDYRRAFGRAPREDRTALAAE